MAAAVQGPVAVVGAGPFAEAAAALFARAGAEVRLVGVDAATLAAVRARVRERVNPERVRSAETAAGARVVVTAGAAVDVPADAVVLLDGGRAVAAEHGPAGALALRFVGAPEPTAEIGSIDGPGRRTADELVHALRAAGVRAVPAADHPLAGLLRVVQCAAAEWHRAVGDQPERSLTELADALRAAGLDPAVTEAAAGGFDAVVARGLAFGVEVPAAVVPASARGRRRSSTI